MQENTVKKEWIKPEILHVDIDETLGGPSPWAVEDPGYHT